MLTCSCLFIDDQVFLNFNQKVKLDSRKPPKHGSATSAEIWIHYFSWNLYISFIHKPLFVKQSLKSNGIGFKKIKITNSFNSNLWFCRFMGTSGEPIMTQILGLSRISLTPRDSSMKMGNMKILQIWSRSELDPDHVWPSIWPRPKFS